MPQKEKLHIYTLCDSAGQATTEIAQTALNQFPHLDYNMRTISFISSLDELREIVNGILAKEQRTIILHAFTHLEFSDYVGHKVRNSSVVSYDILHPVIHQIGEMIKVEPTEEISETNIFNEKYFDRIGALEFAVIHDDGKHPKGFLDADLIILGVSRTSKTPLSIYLANQNYKVANLPIIPEASIPEEIWQVDPDKIFGLTSDLDILLEIRKERLESYGLHTETPYSNRQRVQKELDYAMELYDQLGCKVINVSSRSIEETASLIINYIPQSNF